MGQLKRYICDQPRCEKEFGTPRALGIHKASHDRKKVNCPKCGRLVMYLETHLKRAHVEDTHKLLESMMNVFTEVEHLREENEQLRAALGRS